MKRLGLFGGALALLVAGLAWATNISVERTPWAFLGGAYFGSQATASSTHAVTKALAGSRDYNFPASANYCLDSPAITVTGAALGDPCMVGSEVSAGDAFAFTCQVTAADTVKVHFCPMFGDGGTIDPADAGFRVRVFSNR